VLSHSSDTFGSVLEDNLFGAFEANVFFANSFAMKVGRLTEH
jgi:hypothetical protein